LLFDFEKERAKWNLERDQLQNRNLEITEHNERIERRNNALLRDNEKLKNTARKHQLQALTPSASGAFTPRSITPLSGAMTAREGSRPSAQSIKINFGQTARLANLQQQTFKENDGEKSTCSIATTESKVQQRPSKTNLMHVTAPFKQKDNLLNSQRSTTPSGTSLAGSQLQQHGSRNT
jgi:hypothetical protein